MDNQRLLIWAFFGLMGWITYQTWLQDYGPQAVATTTEQVEQTPMPVETDELPALTAADDDALDAPMPTGLDMAETASANTGATIRVTTDVLDLVISTEEDVR